VEEPTENHQPAASHWQTLLHNVVSSTPHLSGIQTHFSGDRHWLHRYKKCSCKSNNQMFKANEWGDTLNRSRQFFRNSHVKIWIPCGLSCTSLNLWWFIPWYL
jgi:hypothetical protein